MPAIDDMQHFSGIFDFTVPFSVGSYEKVRILQFRWKAEKEVYQE